ncbi:MAG: peptidyl-prolyl cis-trans isomerase [Candidatus Hydrogenedentes bacterium]|nr:peptidyl-prolyl cis-trans isomerase [Candidatus Hydrogenedentota bacterium]
MRQFHREPLVHFLLIGAALFLAHYLIQAPSAAAPESIVISKGIVESLKQNFSATENREPTASEVDGLIRDYIREEVSVREATRLGLDRDDSVIRARLVEKMDFLVRDTFQVPEPTEAEMKQYYDAHPEDFEIPAQISFRHVLFSTARRSDAKADAQAALASLSESTSAAEAAALGDGPESRSMYTDMEQPIVTRIFGQAFSDALFALKPGAWRGPIESEIGFHLVRVMSIVPKDKLTMLGAHDMIVRGWQEQRQRDNTERYFADLMMKYAVVDEESKPINFTSPKESEAANPVSATDASVQ